MSYLDVCAAAVNGAAMGVTAPAEAKEDIVAQTALLLCHMLANPTVERVNQLHEQYGVTLEVSDGRVSRVFFS